MRSAVELAAAVNRGALSAGEVVGAALDRIAALDRDLRAFTEVWGDRARADAARIDQRVRDGADLPLAGVPIGLKASEGNATAQAQRLLAAGCVAVGTTSVPPRTTAWQTAGITARGRTLNPWNRRWSPGGSSAGSAVAVAAGMVPMATGSDGAGSVRIPAAWCGVLGLKLTNGRLPARDRAGLNAPGIIACHASDLAAYVEVVTGVADLHPMTTPLRVAWSPDLGYAETEPEIADVARAALDASDVLEMAPVRVELRDPGPAWTALRGGDRDPATVELNDQRLRDLFEQVDLIATPTTPNPPHGHSGPGTAMSVALTWTFNLSGHPAISLPAGRTASGAPVGLQLVAPHLSEELLLAVANCHATYGLGDRPSLHFDES